VKTLGIDTYKNKTTGEVRHFILIKSTFLKDPQLTACFSIDEVPEKALVDAKVNDYLRFTLPNVGPGPNLHEYFLEREFRAGDWEKVVASRPTLPDLPLPDPSEIGTPHVNRGLLDSARQRFQRKPS